MADSPFQSLIESVLEAVLLVDPLDLRITAANRAAEQLIGVPRADLVGRAIVDFASTSQDLFFWEDVAAGRETALSEAHHVLELVGLALLVILARPTWRRPDRSDRSLAPAG